MSGNRLITFLNEVELVVCNDREFTVEPQSGFHTGFFAGGGKLFRISEYPCRGAWGYSIRGSLSLDV